MIKLKVLRQSVSTYSQICIGMSCAGYYLPYNQFGTNLVNPRPTVYTVFARSYQDVYDCACFHDITIAVAYR